MKKTKVNYFFASWDNNAYEKLDKFYNEVKNLKVPYEVIDVETQDGVQKSIKYGVRNVPTIVYTVKGKEVDRDKGNTAYQRMILHV